MDPISQAVVGVTAAKSQNKSNTLLVILIAASAGMAPDLDILINSDKNPLLSVAIIGISPIHFFIPFGALIVRHFTIFF